MLTLVKLRIKSPSAAVEDLEFEAGVNDSVMEVKERISSAYPTKPEPKEQKLVYMGKILNDSDLLSDILRFEEEVERPSFTFHLVCALTPAKEGEGVRYRGSRGVVPAGPVYHAPSAPTSSPAPTAQGESMEEMMRSFSSQYTEAMASLPPAPSNEDMAALQELYSQYLGLYIQYLGSQGQAQQVQAHYQHLVAPPAAQAPPHQAGQAAGGAQQAGAGGDAGPGGPPHLPEPNAGMVMNAGGGGAVAAEPAAGAGDRNRDILDWVYVMTRVMLLFSVIYFHSSFLRLAFVAGLGFLVFLYQGRQNRAQPNHQHHQHQQQQQEQPEQQHEEEEVEPSDEREEGDQEQQQGEGEEVTPEEEPKPTRLAVTLTFFTSLISSIIPEQNQVT